MPRKLLDTVRGFDYPGPSTVEKQKKEGNQNRLGSLPQLRFDYCHTYRLDCAFLSVQYDFCLGSLI